MSAASHPWTRLSAAAIVALLAIGASACGTDSQGDPNPKPTAKERRKALSDAERLAFEDRTGMLVESNGEVARALGDERVNRRVVATLRRIQHAFRARDTATVCAHMDDFMFDQFRPGRTGEHTPCRAKMAEFARVLERRRRKPAELKLLWVRSYGQIAGIWVERANGKRFRVPFNSMDVAGRWDLEFGSFPAPQTLNARLVGRGQL